MNKGLKKTIFWTVFSLVMVGFAFGGYKLFCLLKQSTNKLLLPSDFQIDINDIYSKDLEKNINNHFAKFVEQKQIKDLKAFCSKLKQEIKLISEVNFKINISNSAKIIVKGMKPHYFVGEKFVLCEDQKLYSAQDFELYDCSKLKRFSISSPCLGKKISDDFYQFLKKVSIQIWDKYNMTYEKPTLIRLRQFNNEYEIIIDEKNIFDSHKIQKVEEILSDVKTNKYFRTTRRGKKVKILMFDLRFNNRVLVKTQGLSEPKDLIKSKDLSKPQEDLR